MSQATGTWLLVADEAVARIFEDTGSGSLHEIETLTDAAAHADGADLRRDAHGRRGAGTGAGTRGQGGAPTVSAGEDEKEKEAEQFAARVVWRLREESLQQRHGQLKVMAAPRFLGRLRPRIERELEGVDAAYLAVDVVHEDPQALQARLRKGF